MSKLKRRKGKEKVPYNFGGDGCVRWCEEFCSIPIPVKGMMQWIPIKELPKEKNILTGRSPWSMWQHQAHVLREALEMDATYTFKYRLVVLCWQRGESKSLLACLIQLWKFFCFPRQQIMLGANSRDQVKFVHFEIMKDIILNSPRLLKIVGNRNLMDKQIQMRDKHRNVVSMIRSISSFSGIVSNISGYTFSEMFDMKNPKFFTQLDGSIRNIPNALGVIDSTVSGKEHVLYKLYTSARSNKSKTVYFNHRCSPEASCDDYWNPSMTQLQIDDYKSKFPPAEFSMYFKNTWESATQKMFKWEEVHSCNYIGLNKQLGEQQQVLSLLAEYNKSVGEVEKLPDGERKISIEQGLQRKLEPLMELEDVYSIRTKSNQSRITTMSELHNLSHVYDTNFAIMIGGDRADPMKANVSHGARTIFLAIAKGLPGSKSNPKKYLDSLEAASKNFIYFVIGFRHVVMSDMKSIQLFIEECLEEYDSVETLCAERWGMWDIADWCDEKDIMFEAITAAYTLQRTGFSELYNAIVTGRFKIPPTAIAGNRQSDLFIEEAEMFDHDPVGKFYGSPEKSNRLGVQDDSVFAASWGIYGGRNLSVEDFIDRKNAKTFGGFYKNTNLVGNY